MNNKLKKILPVPMLNLMRRIKRRFFNPYSAAIQGSHSSCVLDFTVIYKKNMFGGDESVSGLGSSLKQTEVLRQSLPKLLSTFNIKTLLDIPCGDFNWMKHVDLGAIKYIGGDIVKELAEDNQKKFGDEKREFHHLDLINGSLPETDAIFCRDCLVHLNFEQGLSAIKNIKASGASYLLTTTFARHENNQDLNQLGGSIWRPLNLQLPPYNFPEPLELFNEECTHSEGQFADKCIGIWRIKDI